MKTNPLGEVNCLNRIMEESDNEGWSDFKNGKIGK